MADKFDLWWQVANNTGQSDSSGNTELMSSVGQAPPPNKNTELMSSVGQAPPPNNNVAAGSSGGVPTSPDLGVVTSQLGDHVYNQGREDTLFDYDKTNYDDLLLSLQSWLGTQITDLLALLGINDPNDLSRSAIEDWNKQLVETIMSLVLTFEQRNYDREVLNEQRQYDDPTNQLARLMAAGVSRDAALQMLGQSNGSGGSGSGTAAQVAQGIPASQSDLNQTQRKTAIANAVFGGIGAIGSLVNAGIGIAQAVPAMRIANAQAYMSQQQVAGYNAANTLAGNIMNAVSSGQLDKATADGWSNATDFENYVHKNPDSHIAKLCAQDGSFAGTFGSIYGRESLNNLWKSRRDSAHAGELFDNFLQQSKLDTFRKEYDVQLASAELENVNVDTLLKDQLTQREMAQIVLLESQNDLLSTQQNLLDLQATEQQLTNQNLQMQFEMNSSGFPMLKQIYLDQLNDELLKWSVITDPEQRQKQMEMYLSDANNARKIAWLEEIRLNAAGDFATKHPKIFGMAQALGICSNGITDKIVGGVVDITSHASNKFIDFIFSKIAGR